MNSPYVNKPTSFGDDSVFDPNSTPDIRYDVEPPVPVYKPSISPSIEYNVEPMPTTYVQVSNTQTPIVGVTGTSKIIVGPSCKINESPWPTIIISVLGAIIIIYTAVAPNVDNNRRIFGIVLIALWTAIWALILWVLWRECHRSASWWLLLIPVILMAIFFILIIILNVGSSI